MGISQMGMGINQMGMGINQMGMGISQMGMGISQMGVALAKRGAKISLDRVSRYLSGFTQEGGCLAKVPEREAEELQGNFGDQSAGLGTGRDR